MKKLCKALLLSCLIVFSVQVKSYAECANVTFKYDPESQYEINTQIGYITDVQFHAGETITFLSTGDSQRWMLDATSVGDIQHLYIKPTAEENSTNLIVNTNQRIYRLILHSTKQYISIVNWSYVEDVENAKNDSTSSQEPKISIKEIKYNDAYKIKRSKSKNWLPVKIYDDGIRTYISVPRESKNDLPTIHILDGKKSNLVNYRITNDGWFIIDRIFDKAILSFTANQSITVTNLKGEQ